MWLFKSMSLTLIDWIMKRSEPSVVDSTQIWTEAVLFGLVVVDYRKHQHIDKDELVVQIDIRLTRKWYYPEAKFFSGTADDPYKSGPQEF